MVYNQDVNRSLRQYLRLAPRPYSMHSFCKQADVQKLLGKIHENVFRIYMRLLVERESEVEWLILLDSNFVMIPFVS